MHALLIAHCHHMLVMAADTLTLRHKDKRKMPTVVTKFRPSRPTADTSVQLTPSEHAQYYNWPMSAYASQAFSTYTSARDLEHLPALYVGYGPRVFALRPMSRQHQHAAERGGCPSSVHCGRLLATMPMWNYIHFGTRDRSVHRMIILRVSKTRLLL